MDTNQIIAIAAVVIALLAVGYSYVRSGRPVTLAGVVESAQAAIPIAEDAGTVLSAIVLGVDQLKSKGDIQSNDEAFQKAFAVARKHHLFADYDPEVLATLIEGAYNSTLGRNRPSLPRGDAQHHEGPAPRTPSPEDHILELWQKEQDAESKRVSGGTP